MNISKKQERKSNLLDEQKLTDREKSLPMHRNKTFFDPFLKWYNDI